MGIPLDRIKVGMWIAVVKRKENDDVPEPPMPWFGGNTKYVEQYSGLPVQVKAISLPFFAIWTGREMTTIDTRAYEFVKVDEKYVKTLLRTPRVSHDHPTIQAPTARKKRKKEKIDPTDRCVRCGCKLRQRSIVISKEPYVAQWHYWCPECNRSNGEVSP